MKISKTNPLTNLEIIERLKAVGISSSAKGKFVIVKINKTSFIVRNRPKEYRVELIVPQSVMIVSFIIGMVVFSILASVIFGQAVVVKGGIVGVSISLLIGSAIYKSQNKETVKFGYQKIQEILLK